MSVSPALYSPEAYRVTEFRRRPGDAPVWLVVNVSAPAAFTVRKLDTQGGASVFSQSGTEYQTNHHAAECSCPHRTKRGAYCKHLAAVAAIVAFVAARKQQEAERAAAIYSQKCGMARHRLDSTVAVIQTLTEGIRAKRAA